MKNWALGGGGGTKINVKICKWAEQECVCVFGGVLQHYWSPEWVMISFQTGQLPLTLIYWGADGGMERAWWGFWCWWGTEHLFKYSTSKKHHFHQRWEVHLKIKRRSILVPGCWFSVLPSPPDALSVVQPSPSSVAIFHLPPHLKCCTNIVVMSDMLSISQQLSGGKENNHSPEKLLFELCTCTEVVQEPIYRWVIEQTMLSVCTRSRRLGRLFQMCIHTLSSTFSSKSRREW